MKQQRRGQMYHNHLKFFSKQTTSFLLNGIILMTLAGCACQDPNKNPNGTKKTANDAAQENHINNPIAELSTLQVNNKLDQGITEAKAIISSNDSQIEGIVKFLKTDEGVKVIADITGLKPGEHGFHIHEFGDCSGKNHDSVGAHYNPTHQKHGKPSEEETHVGDLGNLVADENGNAHYEELNTVINLQGRASILGRSIIIHADKDDYVSQPAGASGLKIACGVIEPSSNL